MIRLESDENEVSIVLEITRNEASLIAQALAPEWRFVEKVAIVATAEPRIVRPTPAKNPRPKASTKPKAKREPTLYAEAETEVRRRLSLDSNSPKSFADLCGPPWKDSAVRWVINTLREAGEVEVTGQKRGTKYRLLNVGSEPDKAAE